MFTANHTMIIEEAKHLQLERVIKQYYLTLLIQCIFSTEPKHFSVEVRTVFYSNFFCNFFNEDDVKKNRRINILMQLLRIINL